jgi:class 3 adenylate cyclase
MYLYLNFTSLYITLGDLTRLDSIGNLALTQWNHNWEDQIPYLAILNNLGIGKAYRNEVDSATVIFHKALSDAKAAGNTEYTRTALNNLGTIKAMTGDMDSAYTFFQESSLLALEERDMDNYIPLLANLATLDQERGNYTQAFRLLDSAHALAVVDNNAEFMKEIYANKANLYFKTSQYKKAYLYLDSSFMMRDSLLNEERVKAVAEMMEKYESEKKARQIKELEVEKLDARLEKQKIMAARNRFLFGGIAVLIIAIGLWSRLRFIRKSRSEIQKQKERSDGLLLNILPAQVAEELKEKGHAEARYYDIATILFSDIVEFTSQAEQMTPHELVEEINTCFKAFDEITRKYGIEKIKTIGDAYMAAGGIPEPSDSSPRDTVMAALAMLDFVQKRKQVRTDQGLPAFEIRIGIHTGPAVAGIVGTRKFQYDIWGDTVNIASRMESKSEPGKLNITESTYQIIKDSPEFKFNPRGRILVKGKGEMQMYFVELAEREMLVMDF